MAKPTIITRADKGSALTWTEGDQNLTNLRDATIGISDGTNSGTLDLNDALTFEAGANVSVTYNPTTKTLNIASGGGGINSVVADTAPQLGGNLDVNGHTIISQTGVDIQMTPGAGGQVVFGSDVDLSGYNIVNPSNTGSFGLNSSGNFVYNGMTFPLADGTSGYVLTTDGSGTLSWAAGGGGGGGITSVSQDTAPQLGGNLDVNGYSITSTGIGAPHITLTPNVNYGGEVKVDSTIELTPSSSYVTNNGFGATLTISAPNGGVKINPYYTSSTIQIGSVYFPTMDGTSGQVLSTDGAGNLTWSSAGGGMSQVSDDTSPTLGGPLDTGGYNIISTSAQDINIIPDAGGRVVLNTLKFPNYDGTSGQVMTTDGAGNLTWNSISLGYTAEDTANKGVANGYASLDANGLVPSTQLPSYVDDVEEYANLGSFPATGESGKIYVAADTSRSYRWTGTVYSEIIASPGTTDNVTEGSVNLYYTDARARASLSAGTGISYNSSTGVITSTVSPGIASVSADTAPSLGGNLDVNGKSIVSVSNGNIVLAPNGTGKTKINNINYNETPYTLTYGATITPDVANGNVQIVTLTGNVTFSAFSNPVSGQSLTLIVKQDATGSRTLTSTMKFAGGTKTLSTAANSVDIITVFYDGTNYWASLGKDFK